MSQRRLRGYLLSFKALRLFLNYEEVCNDMTDILAKEGVGDQILPWTLPLDNDFCILGMAGLGGNRGNLCPFISDPLRKKKNFHIQASKGKFSDSALFRSSTMSVECVSGMQDGCLVVSIA